ncbi:hypothetical protein KCU64_g62, partial [Aureobasidium melanogenum]
MSSPRITMLCETFAQNAQQENISSTTHNIAAAAVRSDRAPCLPGIRDGDVSIAALLRLTEECHLYPRCIAPDF